MSDLPKVTEGEGQRDDPAASLSEPQTLPLGDLGFQSLGGKDASGSEETLEVNTSSAGPSGTADPV